MQVEWVNMHISEVAWFEIKTEITSNLYLTRIPAQYMLLHMKARTKSDKKRREMEESFWKQAHASRQEVEYMESFYFFRLVWWKYSMSVCGNFVKYNNNACSYFQNVRV